MCRVMAELTWNAVEALTFAKRRCETVQLDLESLRELVFRLSYAMTLDYTQAEDLAQDCLIKIWQHRTRMAELECPEAWIAKVVTNKARSYWRRTKKWLPLQDTIPAPGEQDPTIIQLRAEISALPEELRAVVLLVSVYGFSYGEAGKALEVPEGTIASRLNKAKSLLAGRIGE